MADEGKNKTIDNEVVWGRQKNFLVFAFFIVVMSFPSLFFSINGISFVLEHFFIGSLDLFDLNVQKFSYHTNVPYKFYKP
jgi:hypothetical protein